MSQKTDSSKHWEGLVEHITMNGLETNTRSKDAFPEAPSAVFSLLWESENEQELLQSLIKAV